MGSWAKMFRPPNLADLDESPNYSTIDPLPDPSSPTGGTRSLIWSGNNASLSPETARNLLLGLRFTSVLHPGNSMSVQYYNLVSTNQVIPGSLLPLNLFSNPQQGYLYTRNVTASTRQDVCSHSTFIGVAGQCENAGIDAIVDLRLRSAETVATDGLDLNGHYQQDTRIGTLSLNGQANYVIHFGEVLPSNNAMISYRNTPHNPMALRLRGLAQWEVRQSFASAAINFSSSYRDNITVPTRPVSSWTTFDLVLGYELGFLNASIGGETTISLRGLNIFNKQPPFLINDVGLVGFDPENADLLGRRLSLVLMHEWLPFASGKK
jgi:hypothetical protein